MTHLDQNAVRSVPATSSTDASQPVYHPYDTDTLATLTAALDAVRDTEGRTAGQLLQKYLTNKQAEGTSVHLYGPGPTSLEHFLRERRGLLIDQTLVFSSGPAMVGGIYIRWDGGALTLSSHT